MVRPADLDRLVGSPWHGTLSYLDYQSNSKATISSTLEVVQQPGLAQVGNDFADAGVAPGWQFRIGYPDEPKMDSAQVVRIEDGGRRLSGEKVLSRSERGDGVICLVTEERGRDDDRPADFRFTYNIAARAFSIRKEVRPDGAAEFFERNCYRWTR